MQGKNKYSNPPVIVIDYLREKELLFKGIYETANSLGYGILDLKYTRNSIIPGTNVKGLLTERMGDDPLVLSFLKQGCKAVRLGHFPGFSKSEKIPEVLTDISVAGRMGAEHFADRRFTDVGFVGHYPWAEYPFLYDSFKERALELGCRCHLLQIKPMENPNANHEQRFEHKRKQLLDWIEKLPKPIGVITYSDLNAASIFTILRVKGIKIPEEVALLGFSNDPLICNFLPTPLSSIEKNEEELGRYAVKLLHQSILGKSVPNDKQVMIPPKKIVVRQSTNLLAVPDPDVARAVQFIWNHFQEQLSIDDVSKATGVARSTLTRKFRKHLNHGINAELRRKRLGHAKVLLRGSGMIIQDIATESGFPNISYFYRTFRKAFATTPEKYRKEYILSQITKI